MATLKKRGNNLKKKAHLNMQVKQTLDEVGEGKLKQTKQKKKESVSWKEHVLPIFRHTLNI